MVRERRHSGDEMHQSLDRRTREHAGAQPRSELIEILVREDEPDPILARLIKEV
jgi:hypothetical protein